MRTLTLLGTLGVMALTGCGLADTTTAAAVAAKNKAAEIERAKELQQKIVGDIEAAQALANQRLREAESDSDPAGAASGARSEK